MVDESAFAPGRNLALTPGKVVHRNKLIELIQYAPKTATVHEVPILFIPPWINKYYILDLQPKNSLIGYLVARASPCSCCHGKTLTAPMDGCTIGDYMDCGPLEASDVIREIIGGHTLNVMGYCIGGTLLAMTLAWLAAKDDHRFASATFMVSLQDFSKVGDTAIFMGESSVDFVEQQMMQRGYLDSREMANMFNLLRSNDLIWANVVNNFLLGNKPPAFDLLYWNSDGTRMARAAHTWYLHNTYVENNLIQPGKIRAEGRAARPQPSQARQSMPPGRKRTTSYRGAAPGASRSWWAGRSDLRSPRVGTSQASSIPRAARAPTGSARRGHQRATPKNGCDQLRHTTGVGGRIGRRGSRSDPARWSSRQGWAVLAIRCCRRPQAATFWRSDCGMTTAVERKRTLSNFAVRPDSARSGHAGLASCRRSLNGVRQATPSRWKVRAGEPINAMIDGGLVARTERGAAPISSTPALEAGWLLRNAGQRRTAELAAPRRANVPLGKVSPAPTEVHGWTSGRFPHDTRSSYPHVQERGDRRPTATRTEERHDQPDRTDA